MASLTAFVQDAYHLYVMKLLHDALEAGAFPGLTYYLSMFFPESRMPFAAGFVGAGMAAGLCISGPWQGPPVHAWCAWIQWMAMAAAH